MGEQDRRNDPGGGGLHRLPLRHHARVQKVHVLRHHAAFARAVEQLGKLAVLLLPVRDREEHVRAEALLPQRQLEHKPRRLRLGQRQAVIAELLDLGALDRGLRRRLVRHGRQLEEIANKNELNAAERKVRRPAQAATQLVQDHEVVGAEHRDLVHDQDLSLAPADRDALVARRAQLCVLQIVRDAKAGPGVQRLAVDGHGGDASGRGDRKVPARTPQRFDNRQDRLGLADAGAAGQEKAAPRNRQHHRPFLLGREFIVRRLLCISVAALGGHLLATIFVTARVSLFSCDLFFL